MVEITVDYTGGLRCLARHGPSGTTLETDAPRDNCGQGERFSPTDLVGAALAACIGTTLGIVAQRKGWNIEGMRLRVEKHMTTEGPRRIERLPVHVQMPAGFPADARAEAERIIHSCPVHRSLHPDIQAPITIDW
jgi:putative redox protein